MEVFGCTKGVSFNPNVVQVEFSVNLSTSDSSSSIIHMPDKQNALFVQHMPFQDENAQFRAPSLQLEMASSEELENSSAYEQAVASRESVSSIIATARGILHSRSVNGLSGFDFRAGNRVPGEIAEKVMRRAYECISRH